MGDLENRVAIVTGGARGIGLGIAEAVADQGAYVVLADILYDEAQESARKLGSDHLAVKHDVRKAESAKNLVDRTLEKFGRIDVLVNNAGGGPNPAPIQDLTEEEYDRVLDINLRGVFLTTRAVVPTLIKQGSGRIINMASIVGQTGFAMIVPYAASKFAVIGVTQFWRTSWRRTGSPPTTSVRESSRRRFTPASSSSSQRCRARRSRRVGSISGTGSRSIACRRRATWVRRVPGLGPRQEHHRRHLQHRRWLGNALDV